MSEEDREKEAEEIIRRLKGAPRLAGYKGKTDYDTGYVYAPYTPLYINIGENGISMVISKPINVFKNDGKEK